MHTNDEFASSPMHTKNESIVSPVERFRQVHNLGMPTPVGASGAITLDNLPS
jgi:hypothetical protein